MKLQSKALLSFLKAASERRNEIEKLEQELLPIQNTEHGRYSPCCISSVFSESRKCKKKDTLNGKEITIRIRLSVKFQAPFIINIYLYNL
jgi:hypothetical protein